LIGFEFAPSSPELIGLRREERGARRLVPLDLVVSESGEGLAAALSTVSSDRAEEEDLERLELGLAEVPEPLREAGFSALRLDVPRLEEPLDERRPDDGLGSSPVGCSRRLSFEPELDFEELREERFGGATRAVSQ
jgi:hypothetical protein